MERYDESSTLLSKCVKVFGAVSAIAGALYGLNSWLEGERLAESGVSIDVLSLSAQAAEGDLAFRIDNGSSKLIEDAGVEVTILPPQANASLYHAGVGTIRANKANEKSIRAFLPSSPIGTRVTIEMKAHGPLPLTYRIWENLYQVTRFAPNPEGKPICTFGMADVLKHETLTPDMAREAKTGCVSPELARPNLDYDPSTTATLAERGSINGWCIAGLCRYGLF